MHYSIAFYFNIGCLYITNGLVCYDCDSKEKAACGDPFDRNSLNENDWNDDVENTVCIVSFVKLLLSVSKIKIV